MNFDKHYSTYDKNSIVQDKVAKNLLAFYNRDMEDISNAESSKKKFKSALEIGCGTGNLTRKFLKDFECEKLILNDIFDVKEFLSDINYDKFIQANIEEMDMEEKLEIILSSSTFQWIKDIDELFKKLSEKSNTLVFSIFIEDNLKEIKDHFGVSLDYKSHDFLEKLLEKYFKNIKSYEEEMTLEFDSPISVLQHLKYTGVTGFKKASVSKVRSFKEKKLTYKMSYFICKNI